MCCIYGKHQIVSSTPYIEELARTNQTIGIQSSFLFTSVFSFVFLSSQLTLFFITVSFLNNLLCPHMSYRLLMKGRGVPCGSAWRVHALSAFATSTLVDGIKHYQQHPAKEQQAGQAAEQRALRPLNGATLNGPFSVLLS